MRYTTIVVSQHTAVPPILHIVTGPCASGKSTFKKKLAKKLGTRSVPEFAFGVDVVEPKWWEDLIVFATQRKTIVVETHFLYRGLDPDDTSKPIGKVLKPPKNVKVYIVLPSVKELARREKERGTYIGRTTTIRDYQWYKSIAKQMKVRGPQLIQAAVSIEDAGIVLPDVLHSIPGYKKLSQKYSRFDRRINFFWYKNSKKYLKKEVVPTSRDILLNRKSIVLDEGLRKHIEYSKRRGLKGTKGLPIYGRISKGIFLLDGNHRRYLLHEAGVKKMKVRMADLERFWKDFKKDIPSMSEVVKERYHGNVQLLGRRVKLKTETRVKEPKGIDWANTLARDERKFLKEYPEMKKLKRVLSKHKKGYIIYCREPDLDEILSRGVYRSGKGSKVKRMDPNQCHKNSARLFITDSVHYSICTGWVVDTDFSLNVWRQHSWIYDNKDGKIVETIAKRKGYFGFKLTKREAKQFVKREGFTI